ncbi:HTH domain-containing protein, partial [Enterococcus hirae]|nr:HTH domain-containing protein [Enterococcus hirae]
MNERSILILKFIIENNAISLEDMSNLLGVSQRTIRNDLAGIDDFLLTNNFDSLKKETVTNFYLANSQKDAQEIMNKLMIGKAPSAENWEEPNFRLATLYTKLFWQKNRITIEYLEKTLSVSRSTINSDLKKLKKILKSMNISLLFELQKGFYLAGSEESKRTLYFSFIKNLLNYNYKAEMLSEDDESFLTYWIKKVEEELMIEISYSSFNQLIITISIII